MEVHLIQHIQRLNRNDIFLHVKFLKTEIPKDGDTFKRAFIVESRGIRDRTSYTLWVGIGSERPTDEPKPKPGTNPGSEETRGALQNTLAQEWHSASFSKAANIKARACKHNYGCPPPIIHPPQPA